MFSPKIKARLVNNAIQFISKFDNPQERITFLMELDNLLYLQHGAAAQKYGNGIHTKHKHLNYHVFFVNNIKDKEKVLDLGCGNGSVAYDVAKVKPKAKITGVDINPNKIEYASKHYGLPNLDFIVADVLKEMPDKTFDVIMLSNVLEHFDKRVALLKNLQKKYKPKRIIVRVPTIERDWRVPLKQELDIDHRLDDTHFIEFTKESFEKEVTKAGLQILLLDIRWGEIWSVISSRKK